MTGIAANGEAYDVVVAGGGTAGVAAAVAAADTGARTLIVERSASLGGAATLRNVLGYCGLYTCTPQPKKAVAGVADRVLALLQDTGGVSGIVVQPDHWTVPILDPESVKLAMDQVCLDSGVDVVLGSSAFDVTREGARITGLTYIDFGGRRLQATARAFVDATGDATLSALALADVTLGVAGRTQTATLSARFGGIHQEARLSRSLLSAAIREAHFAGLPVTSSTGFVGQLPISGDVIAYLADEDVDALDARAYSAATRHAREQAWAYLEVLRSLPGCEGAYLVSTGPELGVRQSRHLVTRSLIKDDDLYNGAVPPDTVALAAWPSEYHPGSGVAPEWAGVGGAGAFGITIDNLHSANTENLFAAGRVLGGELRAGASVRVLGTAFATGQAAGVAAALSALTGSSDLSGGTRAELESQGALLSL